MTDEIVKVEFATYQPAEITADFDAMKAELDKLLEPYHGMTDEALMRLSTKEVKSCRTDVNRIITNVEDGRKAIKRAYNEPLAQFEAKVKELLEPARDAADQLKAIVDKKEEQEKALRLEGLENTYLDAAPALADVVPFERLLAEKPEWTNKSYGAAKAAEEIIERTVKLAKDWEALKKMEGAMPFYQEAEAEFFRTLDLGKAVEYDNARQQEQAKIDAMKVEVEEYRETSKSIEETQEGVETGELFEFVFTVQCTRVQADEIISFLKSKGIQGRAGKVA